MLNVSLGELLVVAAVACLVFKPEELPVLTNKVGRFIAKGRDKLNQIKKFFFQNHDEH